MEQFWWVISGSYAYGPFDCERDARIAQKALATHAEWMTWEVTPEPAFSAAMQP